MKLDFTWSTRRDGNNGYVLEESSLNHIKREFGPMPTHIVPAFVEARRRLIALRAQSAGAEYVDPQGFDWMKDISTTEH